MVRSSKSSASPTGNGTDEKKETPRKKVWKPKTKTGCITCRIRRVKCDEGKPFCHRCTSTGRKCDGYANPAPPSQNRQVVRTTKALPKSLVPRLDLDSTEEHEAFHFYKQRSATELSGFFDSDFWQIEILQASHTLPAIRHALIALAAMHRKLIVGRMPVVPDDSSDKELRFALQQSNCAIKEIVNSPVRTTLTNRINMMTSCILFHCLACIQGHQRLALEHLRSGLKILKEVDDDIAMGIHEVSDHPISLSTLRAMFVTMDVRSRGIMCEEMLATWGPTPKRDAHRIPTTFKTFAQARYFFEATFHQIIRFMQDLDLHPPTGPEEGQAAALEYKLIEEHFNEGSHRLDNFLEQVKYMATSDEDHDSLISIRLIHDQTRVYLRAFPGFDGQTHVRDMTWHIEEHDMVTMLDLACQLLKAPPDLTIPAGARPEEYYPSPADREYVSGVEIPSHSKPTFCSGSSLLSGLWLVASRAKASALRRKACALLLDYPRREGVWDSVLAGRIAWEILVLEETAQDGELGVYRNQSRPDQPVDYIPQCNKVLDLVIDYVDMRVATVEYRTGKHFAEGRRGYISKIAW